MLCKCVAYISPCWYQATTKGVNVLNIKCLQDSLSICYNKINRNRIENYILLQRFVLWCTRKPTFFKLHERIVQEKKFILNLNIDSILRISADYRTKCKRQKDLSYSHIYSHTYTQMQIYEWFYICWYIVCIQTDMIAIFSVLQHEKDQMTVLFLPNLHLIQQ